MRSVRWMFVIVAALMVAGQPALADGPQTATIEGRVLDASGSPLPGVTISLSGPQGASSTVTDDDGSFRFALLVAGEYTVGATLEGLGSTEAMVPLGGGERQRVELSLGGQTAETITVTSEAPLVNKYETSATTALEGEVSENLTFINRNVQSSLEVLPGVVHGWRSRLQGGIQASMNGGSWQENAGFVDGVDTSFAKQGGGSRIFLPITSLTETKVETAGFSAEYGRVVAGVTSSVIKSGTNQFHGDFLYIPQNEKWKAEYDELAIPRDDEIIDSFETSLGGPILRDKAWFFASYAHMDSNEADVIADGTHLNTGFQTEAAILKINFQPSSRHQIQATGIDAPMDKIQISEASGDQWSPCDCALDENLATLTWSFGISNAAFLETKVATQQDATYRDALNVHPIVAGASPESPLGNNFPYQDLTNQKRFNAIGQGAGIGYIDTARDQANASLALFRGSHELKFGVDYQDVASETLNQIGVLFRGRGYNPLLPGGFVNPQDKRVFTPGFPVETTSEVLSAYAQDRFDVTDRFNLYVGLRMDDAAFTDDAGKDVHSSTNYGPRLAATYDVNGGGKFLIKATAGRYYQEPGQDLFNEEYATQPNGTNQFVTIQWDPATRTYSGRSQPTIPTLGFNPGTFDPYYKDEVSLGFDWQFVDAWALKLRGSLWEQEDLFWTTTQFTAAGIAQQDVRNWDDGFREYEGIQLELNRAMRDNWTVRTNYTLSETTGNTFGNINGGTLATDDLFDGLGGIEVGTGRTDASIVNREGIGNFSRKHVLNAVGLKIFPIGSHSIALGGYFGYRAGEYWGKRTATQVRHPVSGNLISTTRYEQPLDAEQLEDTFTLNLNGHWRFPIAGQVEGRVGVEAVNITNEQEVIAVNHATGLAEVGKLAFQSPREYRLQVGITF
jgi:hypothetical protein